jgi:hypothetical protein
MSMTRRSARGPDEPRGQADGVLEPVYRPRLVERREPRPPPALAYFSAEIELIDVPGHLALLIDIDARHRDKATAAV